LKSARLAILPPSTEDYCFVRAVPLADEAFFTAPQILSLLIARNVDAPCF
jgi:hypothetical protein